MIIEPRHFEYLAVQRGEVSDERHDFKAWKAAYERSLLRIYSSIRGALPNRCTSVLDIGSGLGGIDVLLAKHFGGLDVCLLDGIDCPPEVRRHAEPFSNREVALDFQAKNGNTSVMYCWPTPPARTFDLIVSFAAWCFHIEPMRYIDVVKAAMHENTTLVLDVRARVDWHDQLRAAFGRPVILHQEHKYFRMAFNCAQQSLSRAAGA
jgi:SAM-dependent methyltransferase